MKSTFKSKMITAIFSLIIGGVSVWVGSKTIKLYFRVRAWTVTNATVLSKKVDYNYSAGGNHFSANVEYQYLFDSKEYINHTVYLVELVSGKSTTRLKSGPEKLILSLPDKIQVYVNPAMPSQSVIFCDGIVLSIFAVVVGLCALFYSLVTFINLL
jgi:hypothetical protein